MSKKLEGKIALVTDCSISVAAPRATGINGVTEMPGI